MLSKDIPGILRQLIISETIYLRHWIGKVVDDQDPSFRGRVSVTVPEIGFMQDSQAMWCSPRQGYAVLPPKPGEWVEVYFIGGDSRRPVYVSGVGEIKGNVPTAYTDPKSRVLWQDATTGDSLVYHEDTQEFDINLSGNVVISGYTSLKIGAGSQHFALGDALSSFLGSLVTWLGTHVHSGVTTGGGVSGPASGCPSVPTIVSSKIAGE